MDINDFIDHVQIMRVTKNDIMLVSVPDTYSQEEMEEISRIFQSGLKKYNIDAGIVVIPESMQVKLIRKEDIHDGAGGTNS